MHPIFHLVRKHTAAFGIFAVLSAGLAFPIPAAAQETVEWDHEECSYTAAPTSAECNPVRQVTVSDGEMIKVVIKNTCPQLFEYTIVRIPRQPTGTGTPQAARTDCEETKGDLLIRHDDQYGGYVVHVTRTAGAPSVGSARLTISVKTAEWNVGFSGGFNITGLDSDAFALRDTVIATTVDGQTTTETKYRIVEQDGMGDEVGRSVASFAHLQHTAWPHIGATFGIGVDADRSAEYYFGPSFHFGERGSLNFGAVIGNVKRLPTGRRLDDLVTDANLLSNLGDRTVVRWFLGLSFRFLDGSAGDNLRKPFLGRTPTEGAAAGVDRGDEGGGAPPRAEPPSPAATLSVESDNQPVPAGQKGTPITVKVLDGEGKPLAGYVVTVENAGDLDGKLRTSIPDGVTGADGTVRIEVEVPAGAAADTHTLKLEACDNARPEVCVQADATVTSTP